MNILPSENTSFWFYRNLFTNNLLYLIVEETNVNAENIFLSEKTNEKSRICAWRPVALDKLLTFVGIFLHMGVVRMPRLEHYWKKDLLFHNKGIASIMSRNRFLVILRALNFARNPGPNDPKPEDPCATDAYKLIRK